ncbi:MAG: cysteine desulfurase [Lachnospiraceae bacterium]|nr:cysteine desulfurase [Lachnospiraceae bacterium]
MKEIYLDNAATTAVSPSAREAVLSALSENYGNPSSLHRKGSEAERFLRDTRETIAGGLRVKEKEIYFTSGGTESNNWAILGGARAKIRQGKHVITSAIEHPSVSESFRRLEQEGFELTVLPVDREGFIRPETLAQALRPDTVLVSLMAVNNEIGTVEPLDQLGALIKEKNPKTLFHADAVQAFGKIPLMPKSWGVDLLTGSSHKIHGPKGCGFLYISENARILPLIAGGGQEKGLRSGTENVPGIAGFGAAAKEALADLSENAAWMRRLRQQLKDGLLRLEGVSVNGPSDEAFAAPHLVSATFRGVCSEVLLHALEEKGIYVSAGSACSSHKREMSPVLKAIGLDKAQAESTLRFSLSRFNTEEEIESVLETLDALLPVLRRFTRR